ncbi:AMP-binding enzyme [Streptomyces sp. INA 01156]
MVRDEEPARGRLVGYVTPADPARGPEPARLRAALAAALPAHMVPSAVVVLDALPLTPQHKIDLRSLPARRRADRGARRAAHRRRASPGRDLGRRPRRRRRRRHRRLLRPGRRLDPRRPHPDTDPGSPRRPALPA